MRPRQNAHTAQSPLPSTVAPAVVLGTVITRRCIRYPFPGDLPVCSSFVSLGPWAKIHGMCDTAETGRRGVDTHVQTAGLYLYCHRRWVPAASSAHGTRSARAHGADFSR